MNDYWSHYRKSIRLKDYDYSQPGYYFVTICAANQECIFGTIIAEQMQLTPSGDIVSQCWRSLPGHVNTLKTDAFVVMPNHIHGILAITDTLEGTATTPPRKWSLGQIVAYYKYESTKLANQSSASAARRLWQPSYYEHVVRNEKDLDRIREYIINNPLQWALDEENPDNPKRDDRAATHARTP